MAVTITKVIRIYPKNKSIKDINCFEICKHLAESASELSEKVIYYVNENENCLDIKYHSRRGSGELGIENDLENFDIWLTSCGSGIDYTGMYVKKSYGGASLYQFDEIRIMGEQKKLLESLYIPFFKPHGDRTPPYFLKKALEEEINNKISFKQNGVYTASNSYKIGEKYSRIPEQVSIKEFLKPRGEGSFIDEFLIYPSDNDGIEYLLKTVFDETDNQYDRGRFEHLTGIQILFKNRVVQEVIWDKTFWRFSSSDWWDNCITPDWIEYKSRIGMHSY